MSLCVSTCLGGMQPLFEVTQLKEKEKGRWEPEEPWDINRCFSKRELNSVSLGDTRVNTVQQISLLCNFSKHLTVHMNLKSRYNI